MVTFLEALIAQNCSIMDEAFVAFVDGCTLVEDFVTEWDFCFTGLEGQEFFDLDWGIVTIEEMSI